MHRIWRASEYVLCQASKTWKQAFREAFCCHPNFGSLIAPKNGYSPFKDKSGQEAYYEERAPLTPSISRSHVSDQSCSRSSTECESFHSNRHEEIRTNSPILKRSSINEIGSIQESAQNDDDESVPLIIPNKESPVIDQPRGMNKEYGACDQPTPSTSPITPEKPIIQQKSYLSLSAPAGLNHISLTPLSSPVAISQDIVVTPRPNPQENSNPDEPFEEDNCDQQRLEPEGSSETSQEDVMKLIQLIGHCVEPVKPICIQTDQDLLDAVDICETPDDVLKTLKHYVGDMTPELAVACVHHIYAKNCIMYERNSEVYNQMCGVIIKDKEFRALITTLEQNAYALNNFALLTAASDLLLLRLTLRKKTIPTLLSHVDADKLTLEELRLLASCLHTPNIQLVDSEYFYNASANVAKQELKNIHDLYTLLNIMKCFGRYFDNKSKRDCEEKVYELSEELWEQWPDGRSKAAHMFDAFYRMEYRTNQTVLQAASDVIVNSDIPVLPQDVSAVLRYCVKYGYGFHDLKLLDRLSSELHKSLDSNKASQLTTNVKWLTVFYYYNKDFMQSFLECVKRDIKELDFVALSDVLDALAQVYFVPEDADEFFDLIYTEMIDKLPTLMTSHVHNAKRKLLLTAFHFAVYGRYPEQLIQLALSESQLSMHMGHNGTRQFLRDLCRAINIERPDLLPKFLPMHLLHNQMTPKLFAFEKDVQEALLAICNRSYFQLMLSPACFFPFFLLQMRLDGTLLPVSKAGFIAPHHFQMVQNVAVIPLPRSRFCFGSKHAIGKTRLVLRLLRAQGARVVTIPHYDWDNNDNQYKIKLLQDKIFNQRIDDIVE